MKKYIILLTAALSFAGCKDFFSNESPSAMDAEHVFSNPLYTEQAMCGAYQELAKDKGYINRVGCGYAGLNTDCEWSSWSTGTDDRAKMVIYDERLENSSMANKNGDLWSFLGTVIERCNNIIEGVQQYGDTTQAVFKYYLGEAYFLRSFAYLEMLKYWGDVPARFESLTKNPESVNARKTDRNVIYDHLRVDLKEAARLMPWSNDADVPVPCRNKVGRGNKGAALALLARIDLMYAGKAVRPLPDVEGRTDYSVRYNFDDDALRKEVLEEVLWACAQVINHEDYKLAAEFETPFRQLCSDVEAYDQMEHLWVIPFANGQRGQILGFNAPKIGSSDITKLAGKLPGVGVGAKSNGHMCITPYLLYQFESGDTRRAVSCVPGTWACDNKEVNGLPTEERVYQKSQNIKSYYMAKYRFEWMAPGRTSTGDDGIDFPVLRYSDVLLMFAEAAIGSNTGVVPTNSTGIDALVQLNRVRARAHVAPIGTLDFEAVKTERAKEFAGEYIRKWDLMRWGILKEEVLKAEAFVRELKNFEDSKTVTLNGKSITVSAYLWYKYRQDPTINNAWVMDSIYGLADGEIVQPAYFDKNNGWIEKKAIFGSDEKGWDFEQAKYPFYAAEEQLESRQYWPIFPHYLTASSGNLWNNYGY